MTGPLVATAWGAVTPLYGACGFDGGPARVGVRLGDRVLDAAPLAAATGFDLAADLARPTLNAVMARGRPAWSRLDEWLRTCLADGAAEPHLVPLDHVTPRLPVTVADYVDFYASAHHARNVGRMFRPGEDPLPRNWPYLPLGYHGRAGTVVVSGTPVVRPRGQFRTAGDDRPHVGPTRRLDFEAEVGFLVGVPTPPHEPVHAERVAEHVFGVCLVNDWSARDIQAWEYRPLGPFLGKSFATSMSAWVLPLSALDAARVPPPPRMAPLLGHLADPPGRPWGLDVTLEVRLNGTLLSRPPLAAMYFTVAQQFAHLTSNGAALRTGDLFATGTVSGPDASQLGCLLELTDNGQRPVTLDGGDTRTFLEDGDEVAITATAPAADGARVALGEVNGRVRAAGSPAG